MSENIQNRRTILFISPYWKEDHRWMASSVKLAELWQRLGYKVIVTCMGSVTGVENVSETLIIHRRKDFFFPDPLNFGVALGFTGYVRRLIKNEKPDLIICNKVLFWTSFSLIPLRLAGQKILLLTDTLVGMTWWPRNFFPKLIMAIGAWTVGWLVLLSAHRIVLFHPQSEKILKRLGIAKKTQVIPTGIDGERYKSKVESLRSKVENQTYDSRHSTLQEGNLTVTYVGRLESVKGVDDFLHAVTPLKHDFPELIVQVVGWYKDRHPLVREFEKDVIFTGLREDIPDILMKTSIFVLPSHSEGLSNALMEAMASSCACIASDVGGNRYLVQNGVSGFLYPAGDREALRSHVQRLIQDSMKRESLGKEARKRIDAVFDWKVVGKQYQQLFTELHG